MGRLINKYKSFSIELKAAFWYLVCSLTQKGISVVFTPIFTRLMTTDQFGQFSVYMSWKDIFVIVITLRLSAGVMGPGLVKNIEDRNSFSSSMQSLSTALVLIWALVFLLFNNQIQRITGLSEMMLLIMVVHVWTQSVWELWAKEQRILFKYRFLVFITILVAIVRPLLGVLAVLYSDNKALARVAEMSAVDFIAYVGLFIFVLYKGRTFFSKKYWKYALTFNIPLIPHFLSQTILHNADRIMIERLVSKSASGVYSLAYSISVMTIFFNNALLQAMSPWTFQKLHDREASDISGVGFGALALVASINMCFIAFAPELVYIFAPPQYYEAIWIIPPVAMSVFFQFSYLLFADIELFFEETKLIAAATTIGAGLNVTLNYLFIYSYGYIAAGYTTLVCYMIISIMHYWTMRKVCNKYLEGNQVYSLKKWISISLVFLVLGFTFLISYNFIAFRYIMIAVLCSLIIICRKRIINIVRMIIGVRK